MENLKFVPSKMCKAGGCLLPTFQSDPKNFIGDVVLYYIRMIMYKIPHHPIL